MSYPTRNTPPRSCPTLRRLSAALAALASAAFAPAVAPAAEAPRLVLQITVDQLRGDLLLLLHERFGEGGFRYLLDNGVHYTNAHYRQASTLTAVGHATLATGGHPAQHGMVANSWYDPREGREVYNCEDPRHQIIGRPSLPNVGTSPRNLLSSTVGDELVEASAGASRVFSVSVKDRGAIIPGGHSGKAFWFSKSDGQFVTSTFYYPSYPDWVVKWNAAKPADAYRGRSWELLHPLATYLRAERDDRPFENKLVEHMGRTFPHPFDTEKAKDFYNGLTVSPVGDELTAAFAVALIENEGVGQGGATDYLAVSFSSTDAVGHIFGIGSLEAEDNVLRLDRTIAGLLAIVDRRVGLDRTLVVLSADHGGAEAPEALNAAGFSVGRHDGDGLAAAMNEKLRSRFDVEADLVATMVGPYAFLDLAAVAEAGLEIPAVERAAAAAVSEVEGVAFALARSDVLAGRVFDSPVHQRVVNAFHPTRSGHVYCVLEPYWHLHKKFATMHGSPWRYDTHIPVIFTGSGLPGVRVAREVGAEDVAATIAAFLGIKPPAGCIGRPLAEVLFGR